MNKKLSNILKFEKIESVSQLKDWQPTNVIRAAKEIEKNYPDLFVSESNSIQKLLEDLKRRKRQSDWDGFYWGNLVQLAIILFDGKQELEKELDVCKFLLHQIHHDGKVAFNFVMFNNYLKCFDQSSKLTEHMANSLGQCNWSNSNWPNIKDLIESFDIFNISKAPERIADFMCSQQDPFDSLLKENIQAPHGQGLMQVVHKIFVTRLKQRIAKGEIHSIKQLLNWIKPPHKENPIEGEAASLAVDALLSPWIKRDPSLEAKEIIKNNLISSYGDPRLRQNINIITWNLCSKESHTVILKWLTGATVKVFYEIIANSVDADVDQRKMWENRKNLWLKYFNEGMITEAWFALNSRASKEAKIIYRKTGDVALQKFGNNTSKNIQDRKKCLLIMKVNGRLVAEGSHNFFTHIFPKNSSDIILYRKSYKCENIRSVSKKTGHVKIHHHPILKWGEEVNKILVK